MEPITDDDFLTEIQRSTSLEVALLVGEGLHEANLNSPFGIDPTKFSSLRRLVRVTAWCLKFMKKRVWNRLSIELKSRYPILDRTFETFSLFDYLTANDLSQSKLMLITSMQTNHFADIFTALKSKKTHSLVKQLNLELSEDGMIRCVGRLLNADVPHAAVTPLLLPKNDYITKLIIIDAHEMLFHAGVSHTLSELRHEFWILHGRNAVRRVITQCLICRKGKGPPFGLPRMPPLPRERVARARPFQFTGVDYLGPVTVKLSEESIQKMWCCLFTCMTVRAVHLECITDCSAQTFIECLSRFIARRGCPDQMISDNAPQFRLAKTIIDKTWQPLEQSEAVRTYIADRGIAWRCITELAPWQGGFYERLVGVVKSTFKSMIGRRFLRWDEFITLITETEAIVNSRPITYVHSDLDSGLALRPMDFITELPTGTPSVDPVVRPDSGDASKHLLSFWKSKQRRLDNVWNQWYNDYLLSLRERDQSLHKSPRSKVLESPTIGEIVIVKNTDAPRGNWKLARVVSLIPSRDGSVRSVELKLPSGLLLKRPVNHLYRLEIPSITENPPTDETQNNTESETDFEGFEESEIEGLFDTNFPSTNTSDRIDVNMPTLLVQVRNNIMESLIPEADHVQR